MPCESWQEIDESRFDDELMVFRIEELRDLASCVALIKSRIGESDRECFHAILALLRHRGDHSRRVHPAREEGANRNVAAKTQASRLGQVVSYDLTQLLVA